jgi:hypothetical protein
LIKEPVTYYVSVLNADIHEENFLTMKELKEYEQSVMQRVDDVEALQEFHELIENFLDSQIFHTYFKQLILKGFMKSESLKAIIMTTLSRLILKEISSRMSN